jgi:hypothetical protein
MGYAFWQCWQTRCGGLASASWDVTRCSLAKECGFRLVDGDTRNTRQVLTFQLVYGVTAPPQRTTLITRASEREGMAKRLSDYCDVAWDAVLTVTCLDAVTAATKITSAPYKSVEERIGIFRLPRSVIAEAMDFAKRYAAVCLQTRRAIPTMPIPNPWDSQRRASLDASIRGCIDRIARLAENNWGVSRQASAVSRSAAQSELLREVADRWEDGLRAYHEALQKCDAPARTKRQSPKAPEKMVLGKRGRMRRRTTDELLQDLAGSEDGWRSIMVAGTIDRIASLIGRSHGAVAESDVWHKTIKPLLARLKAEREYARIELDERRQDRRKTD